MMLYLLMYTYSINQWNCFDLLTTRSNGTQIVLCSVRAPELLLLPSQAAKSAGSSLHHCRLAACPTPAPDLTG